MHVEVLLLKMAGKLLKTARAGKLGQYSLVTNNSISDWSNQHKAPSLFRKIKMASKKQTLTSRTSDRFKRTRNALKNDRKRRHTMPTKGTNYTWCLNEEETEEMFEDLDVSVLRWPNEGVRDSSQDQDFDKDGKTTSKNLGKRISKNTSTRSRILASKQSRSCGVCGHHQITHSKTKKNGNTDKLDLFTVLSDEMILGIFEYVSRHTLSICAQVSKQWQILAYDESLWRCVDMAKTKLFPGVLGTVLLRGTKVLRLATSRVCSPIFDENLNIFPDVVPVSLQSSDCLLKLCYLDATLCIFEDNSLLCLLMHSRRLKYLSLDSSALSISIQRAIGQCQDLKKLNLAMCSGINLQGVKALVNGCKRLTELNLAWTNLSKESVLQVVQNLPNLIKLNISGCRESLTDEAVVQLVQNSPKLTHLDLSDAIQITAISLEAMADNLDLRQLAISRCYSIAPQAFRVCTQIKCLEKLEVYGLLNTDGVDLLKKELPGISLNSCLFSTIARPVQYKYDGTIWGIQCKRYHHTHRIFESCYN